MKAVARITPGPNQLCESPKDLQDGTTCAKMLAYEEYYVGDSKKGDCFGYTREGDG